MPTPTFLMVSIATIASLFFFKKVKNTKYVFFVYYLIFAFFIELLAFLFAKVFIISTIPLYNTYTIITFIFYFLFYRSIYKNKRNKKIMIVLLVIYLLFCLYDIIFLKSHFIDNNYINNIVFGSVLIIITLILFLVEIVNNENLVFNIKKSLIFWISTGALLLYIGVIPIMISGHYLNFDGVFDNILTPLNIIMYGSFTIGFIYSDTKYSY